MNLLLSPTGGEGALCTRNLERTVFWFKEEDNGNQRTVAKARLTILCAPGNSERNLNFSSIYLQDLRVLLRGNALLWLTGHAFLSLSSKHGN